MGTGILLIGEKEKSDIARAIERARRRPLPWDVGRQMMLSDRPTVKLKDRNLGAPDRDSSHHRPQQVLIPIGYRAMVSFEEQPSGICMHLSISVEREDVKWMPSEHAVRMIAKEFGITFDMADKIWIEEYEPGRHAVNILVLVERRKEGHA